MRMMRITVPLPTAVVASSFGVALIAAGLIGWHLGDPSEAPTQSEVRREPHPAPEAHSDPVPASEFERDCNRLLKELDDIQERMTRAEASMPPVRARRTGPAEAERKMIEEMQQKMRDKLFLERPLYIVPVPLQ